MQREILTLESTVVKACLNSLLDSRYGTKLRMRCKAKLDFA